VRPLGVVLAAEAGEADLGAAEGVEELAVEELVAELVVEALDVGVLPRGAGVDVEGVDLLLPEPVADGVGDELRPVVRAQVARRPAPGHHLGDDRDHVLGPEAPGRMRGQALAGVLVHHGEDLEASPGAGLVVHEVAAPDVVRMGDLLALRDCRAQPACLALALAHPEAAFGTDAPHPLRVHAEAGTAQECRDPSVAVAGMPLAQLHDALGELAAGPATPRHPVERRPRQAQRTAHRRGRIPGLVHAGVGRPPSDRRAHHFLRSPPEVSGSAVPCRPPAA